MQQIVVELRYGEYRTTRVEYTIRYANDNGTRVGSRIYAGKKGLNEYWTSLNVFTPSIANALLFQGSAVLFGVAA